MVALIISYFLLVYLLGPRLIFRFVAGFVRLKFDRTRSDEVAFAVLISVIPLILAACLDRAFCGLPSLRNYELIFASSYSEGIFKRNQEEFWRALWDVVAGQGFFVLLLYYPLILGEAGLFVLLIRKYGAWRTKSRLYERLVQKVLLRPVNEWHVLLTPFNFPDAPKRRVVADVLVHDDHLYQGDVAQYFVDADGALSGLIMLNPRRFDRPRYLVDKSKNPDVRSMDYWRDIPSSALYIPQDKILNLNIRYPEIGMETASDATRELQKEGIPLTVEVPADGLRE